jgi:putative ABC transport system permease protein
MLRPLPYQDPDRLVMVWEESSRTGDPKQRPAPGNFTDWQDQSHAFVAMAAMTRTSATLTGGAAPEQVLGHGVSANLFSVLGVAPLLGRTFTEDEARTGAHAVILSAALWQRRFGADPALLGRTIQMNDAPYEVVGVMPPDFAFPDRTTEFWRPLGLAPDVAVRRNSHFLNVVARLKPDVNLTQAQEDMSALAARLARQYPATNTKLGAVVVPLKTELLGDTRVSLLALVAAAACVLLIACANVANLLLARAWARQREIAVRMALGARRGRLIRQMLTESTVLAVVAGTAGLALAGVAAQALTVLVPADFAGATSVGLDVRAVAFTATISILTGLLFGIAPALQLSAARVHDVMKETGRSATGRPGWIRDTFVVSEIALALVLLIGAGLLIETLARLNTVDAGFDPHGVLTAEAYVSFPKYDDRWKRDQFYRQVVARLRVIPGVTSAGLTSDIPFTSRGNTMGFLAEGKTPPRGSAQDALFRLVSADYFATMRIPIARGRAFAESDDERGQPVAMVNDTMAAHVWPNEDAIGRRIQVAATWYVVVGVVHDVRERGLDYSVKDAVYLPFPQFEPSFFVPSQIAIRASVAEPERLTKALQAAVWSVDPDQPVTSISLMDRIVDGETAGRTRVFRLLAVLSAIAITLAALGIHGVLSYSVALQQKSIGLRLALGASPASVVLHVVSHGMRLAVLGQGVGGLIALGATRWLGSLLFGVSATDPHVFATVAAALMAVSLGACFLPARHAARVDPAVALRSE